MHFLIVLLGILLLLVLIVLKLHPVLALLITSVITGLMLQMPVAKVITSITNGVGNTLGGLVFVLSFGAMLGKLVEETGVAKKIVAVLISAFRKKNIQWAVLLTGILIGIPLFYNAGFVVLIPLVFTIAATTRLPVLYVGIPMAAALSITHGFLPPHPGPIALATIFKANVGKTLIFGLVLSIPIATLAGIALTRILIKPVETNKDADVTVKKETVLPTATKSFFIALLPVFLIAIGTIGNSINSMGFLKSFFTFLQDPTMALLVSVLAALAVLKLPMEKAMNICVEGVKNIAMILLVIAAGGAFKQILIDSGIGQEISAQASFFHLSPLVLAWLIAAILRIALGSATVAALTASGIVLPLIKAGVSPELMVLSVGAGSLMCSHVNDTGFWMFKEYFGLTLKQTFGTWTLMESTISVLGLLGVLLLQSMGF